LVQAAGGYEPSVSELVSVAVLGVTVTAASGRGRGTIIAVAVVAIDILITCIVILRRRGTSLLRRGLDFVQIVGGEEAAIAEQRLVDCAELVDGEQLVADTPAATASTLAAAERHQP